MTRHDTDPVTVARRNARVGLAILALVFVMAGLSYAAVPLYSLFCKTTGFGGTTQVSKSLPDHVVERSVRIRFNTDTDPHLPWDFRPERSEISVKLGQKGLIVFLAYNKSAESITGTAVYNVTPPKAGKYFNKIQCFCFSEQTLAAGQRVSMPVVFYVDPALQNDPNMADVKSITLSYTFFKADTKALEKAIEGFSNVPE